MSIDQANAFRTFVNENESVQEQIQAASTAGTLNLSELAADHGYTFTAEDYQMARGPSCGRCLAGMWLLAVIYGVSGSLGGCI